MANKKSRQINGLINEWYLEDMSQNIKSVLTDKRKKGIHIGAFAPYGYKKDSNQKGHLIIDKINGIITKKDYVDFSDNFNSEKEKIENLISETKNKILVLEEKISNSYNRKKIIEQYTNVEKLNREDVEKLIDCIYVGKRENRTKGSPIEIHWTF